MLICTSKIKTFCAVIPDNRVMVHLKKKLKQRNENTPHKRDRSSHSSYCSVLYCMCVCAVEGFLLSDDHCNGISTVNVAFVINLITFARLQ